MKTFYTTDRGEWRAWLSEHFETEREIWFVFPMIASGESRLSYNDAVEEALCFGWIDGVIKNIDDTHRAQRFTPRKKGSPYSRPNVERLIWLEENDLIHPSIRESVLPMIRAPYEFPEAYKRIRVAYIDAARKRPGEFDKRLANFIVKTRAYKMFGYGGIDKYFR